MIKLIKIVILTLTLQLLLFSSVTYADDLVLITQRNSNISISSDHLKRLYFGKIASLPNGRKVTAVVYAKDEEQFQRFTKMFLGRTSQQLRAFWAKQLFTGKGNLPIRVNSLEEMLERVSSSDEYIGYIPIELLHESVEVLNADGS